MKPCLQRRGTGLSYLAPTQGLAVQRQSMKETEKERGRERAGKGVGGRNDWLIGCGAERVSYRDSEKRKKGINI